MITFTVRGLPAPQGSKRAIVNRYTKRAALVESSARVKPWRADVREAAAEACDRQAYEDGLEVPTSGPVAVELAFRFPRPRSHYGTGRNARALSPRAPIWPAGKPDIDKLARAVLDAITAIVFVDDAQVVDLGLRKRYADDEAVGVTVTVRDLAANNGIAAARPAVTPSGAEQLGVFTTQED